MLARALLLLATAIAAVLPAGAQARERIGFATGLSAAAAADGRVWIAGIRPSRTGGRTDAMSWTALPGGNFGAGRRITRSVRPERIAGIGIAADGTGALVWLRRGRVQLATLGRDGRLGRRRTLTRAATGEPVLEVSPRGDLVVAWVERRGSRHRVTVTYRLAGSDAFAPPERLPGAVEPDATPLAAADGDGEAVVAWASSGGMRASVLGRGGSSFGPPRTVLPGVADAVIAIGPDGTTLLVGAADALESTATWRAPGRRTWTAPAAAPAALPDGPFDLAIGPDGRAVALRYDMLFEAGRGEPLVTTGRLGAGSGASVAVATGAGGSALVLTGGERLEAFRRAPDGLFGDPRVLGPGPGPVLGERALLLEGGGALALWSRLDPGPSLYAAWLGPVG